MVSKFWFSPLLLLLLVAIKAAKVQAYKDYKDFKIYSVTAHTETQRQMLLTLSKQDRAFDFFHLNRQLNASSRVLVPPSKRSGFVSALEQYDVSYALLLDDVSSVLAATRRENAGSTRVSHLNVFERYIQHDEINSYLTTLAEQHPTRVYVKAFGRSYEGRPLKTITITNGDAQAQKKVIFIDAALHAREWITVSMALHIINELVFNDKAHAELLRDYDWVILPVVNADGYEYTHTEDRYWRKTRTPNRNQMENCYGTDPNRNFGFQWGLEEGASADPCDETYMGESAFSESETQVVRDIMWHYSGRLKFYLSMHSYGNYMLLPWGYTNQLPEHFYEMMDIADAGAMAILFATNSAYTYGSTNDVMYASSGDSTDYALGAVGIPVTIAMELPAGGWSGFDPPVRQIEDIVTETWIGIKAMAEVVVRQY